MAELSKPPAFLIMGSIVGSATAAVLGTDLQAQASKHGFRRIFADEIRAVLALLTSGHRTATAAIPTAGMERQEDWKNLVRRRQGR